jgi:hypothetical protein
LIREAFEKLTTVGLLKKMHKYPNNATNYFKGFTDLWK